MPTHTIHYPRKMIPVNELVQDLTRLSDKTTSLDLRCYSLIQMKKPELEIAFKAIPKNVTELHLVKIDLGNKSGSLTPLFSSLSESENVTTLSLKGNNLLAKDSQELAESFAAFPYHINSLDLQCNGFDFYSTEKLAKIFRAIPYHIVELTMSYHEICLENGSLRTTKELLALGNALPYLLRLNIINVHGDEIKYDNVFVDVIRNTMGYWSKAVHAFCFEAMHTNPEAPLLPKSLVFEVLTYLTEPPFAVDSQIISQYYFNQNAVSAASSTDEGTPIGLPPLTLS